MYNLLYKAGSIYKLLLEGKNTQHEFICFILHWRMLVTGLRDEYYEFPNFPF